MATLTQASIITRKTIRYGIYGIIGIILLRGLLLTAIKIYRYYFPAPPPPPTVAFGKLPTLPFPQTDFPGDISFKVETASGNLPDLPYQAKIYYMPKPASQLLSLDSAKEKATKLGFSAGGAEVSETIYSFPHPRAPVELKISIVSGVFSISYDLRTDPSPLMTRPLPPEVAASKARSFLSTANLLPDDLTGQTISEPVKLENDKIVSAISLSEANFVRVNFFRKSFDDFPSLTSEPNRGNVWFIISGESLKEKQIVAGEYHYFRVDEDKSSTYPVKTAEEALNELTSRKAYIANLGGDIKTKVIRRIYLAYYDPGISTDFYQPIIVFEGDRGFMAYVPAVSNDYYGEEI